eukprot:5043923-Karenia_brevis.AAC.1
MAPFGHSKLLCPLAPHFQQSPWNPPLPLSGLHGNPFPNPLNPTPSITPGTPLPFTPGAPFPGTPAAPGVIPPAPFTPNGLGGTPTPLPPTPDPLP